MTRFKQWLAEVGRRLLAGKAGAVPALKISEFERRKLRGDFPY